MNTWTKVALAAGVIIGPALLFRVGSRVRRLRLPPVAPADIEAAIKETAREILGGENEVLERALLAWADLESGFRSDTVTRARTGFAMGLFQLLDRFFLPIAIERGMLPPEATKEDLLIPIVNIRLGVQNVIDKLNHEDNQAGSFTMRFLRARSSALGCGFECGGGCERRGDCARVTRRGIAALQKWGVS